MLVTFKALGPAYMTVVDTTVPEDPPDATGSNSYLFSVVAAEVVKSGSVLGPIT